MANIRDLTCVLIDSIRLWPTTFDLDLVRLRWVCDLVPNVKMFAYEFCNRELQSHQLPDKSLLDFPENEYFL